MHRATGFDALEWNQVGEGVTAPDNNTTLLNGVSHNYEEFLRSVFPDLKDQISRGRDINELIEKVTEQGNPSWNDQLYKYIVKLKRHHDLLSGGGGRVVPRPRPSTPPPRIPTPPPRGGPPPADAPPPGGPPPDVTPPPVTIVSTAPIIFEDEIPDWLRLGDSKTLQPRSFLRSGEIVKSDVWTSTIRRIFYTVRKTEETTRLDALNDLLDEEAKKGYPYGWILKFNAFSDYIENRPADTEGASQRLAYLTELEETEPRLLSVIIRDRTTDPRTVVSTPTPPRNPIITLPRPDEESERRRYFTESSEEEEEGEEEVTLPFYFGSHFGGTHLGYTHKGASPDLVEDLMKRINTLERKLKTQKESEKKVTKTEVDEGLKGALEFFDITERNPKRIRAFEMVNDSLKLRNVSHMHDLCLREKGSMGFELPDIVFHLVEIFDYSTESKEVAVNAIAFTFLGKLLSGAADMRLKNILMPTRILKPDDTYLSDMYTHLALIAANASENINFTMKGALENLVIKVRGVFDNTTGAIASALKYVTTKEGYTFITKLEEKSVELHDEGELRRVLPPMFGGTSSHWVSCIVQAFSIPVMGGTGWETWRELISTGVGAIVHGALHGLERIEPGHRHIVPISSVSGFMSLLNKCMFVSEKEMQLLSPMLYIYTAQYYRILTRIIAGSRGGGDQQAAYQEYLYYIGIQTLIRVLEENSSYISSITKDAMDTLFNWYNTKPELTSHYVASLLKWTTSPLLNPLQALSYAIDAMALSIHSQEELTELTLSSFKKIGEDGAEYHAIFRSCLNNSLKRSLALIFDITDHFEGLSEDQQLDFHANYISPDNRDLYHLTHLGLDKNFLTMSQIRDLENCVTAIRLMFLNTYIFLQGKNHSEEALAKISKNYPTYVEYLTRQSPNIKELLSGGGEQREKMYNSTAKKLADPKSLNVMARAEIVNIISKDPRSYFSTPSAVLVDDIELKMQIRRYRKIYESYGLSRLFYPEGLRDMFVSELPGKLHLLLRPFVADFWYFSIDREDTLPLYKQNLDDPARYLYAFVSSLENQICDRFNTKMYSVNIFKSLELCLHPYWYTNSVFSTTPLGLEAYDPFTKLTLACESATTRVSKASLNTRAYTGYDNQLMAQLNTAYTHLYVMAMVMHPVNGGPRVTVDTSQIVEGIEIMCSKTYNPSEIEYYLIAKNTVDYYYNRPIRNVMNGLRQAADPRNDLFKSEVAMAARYLWKEATDDVAIKLKPDTLQDTIKSMPTSKLLFPTEYKQANKYIFAALNYDGILGQRENYRYVDTLGTEMSHDLSVSVARALTAYFLTLVKLLLIEGHSLGAEDFNISKVFNEDLDTGLVSLYEDTLKRELGQLNTKITTIFTTADKAASLPTATENEKYLHLGESVDFETHVGKYYDFDTPLDEFGSAKKNTYKIPAAYLPKMVSSWLRYFVTHMAETAAVWRNKTDFTYEDRTFSVIEGEAYYSALGQLTLGKIGQKTLEIQEILDSKLSTGSLKSVALSRFNKAIVNLETDLKNSILQNSILDGYVRSLMEQITPNRDTEAWNNLPETIRSKYVLTGELANEVEGISPSSTHKYESDNPSSTKEEENDTGYTGGTDSGGLGIIPPLTILTMPTMPAKSQKNFEASATCSADVTPLKKKKFGKGFKSLTE